MYLKFYANNAYIWNWNRLKDFALFRKTIKHVYINRYNIDIIIDSVLYTLFTQSDKNNTNNACLVLVIL